MKYWILKLVPLVISLVWFYHGAINKLLSGAPSHFAILASVPFLERIASSFLLGIALFEIGLACWVLSGYRARLCSVVQTSSVILMNAGGLYWARNLIPDIAEMVVNNLTFLALIWLFEFTRTR